MKGVVNSAPFFYIARNPDHECLWGHTETRGDIFRESGSGCYPKKCYPKRVLFGYLWKCLNNLMG